MNDSPKIQLSAFEKQLVTDSTWLLTKNAILEKIWKLLAGVQDEQHHILAATGMSFPSEVLRSSAKITRGENYLGLPWLVLDQPRFFERENVFAIRTMFWWGKFFSTTLQLSGLYKVALEKEIARQHALLSENDFYISHSASPWNHHFEDDNYRPVSEFDEAGFERLISTHPFIKLAKKTTLDDWENIHVSLLLHYRQLIDLITGKKKNTGSF